MNAPKEYASGKLILDRPAGAVARIRICNPPKRGALDHEILDGIAELVPSLDQGIETRCLILTGSGHMFSSGYDIGDIPEEVFAQEAERLVAHPFGRAIEAIDEFSFPTLAAINGHALGGGLELALSCDLRISSTEAKLGMPPAKLGLIYSHTGLHKFIDAIGPAHTREMFFVGRNLPARRAEQIGLVNEVHEPEALDAAAVEIAAEIAANAPLSLKGNKRIIKELTGFARLSDADEQALIDLRLSSFKSDDFKEGVRAFAEKRKAQWKGR